MPIEWNEELATGIKEIDDQHKEIIKRMQIIDNSSEQMVSEEEIDKMVRFFGGYMIEHFDTEDKYMIDYKYPKYDLHKSEHMKFLKNFAVLKRLCEEEDSTSLIILAIQNQFLDWLVHHILHTDKEMAAYLRTRI